MRIKKAIKNIATSIISQIVIIILGFVSRKVFIDNLGTEYLGINGLLTNILSMMVLIEGGIGISIVYNLYKPLAENNKEQIIALVNLYKKSYRVLALIILIISIFLYPFLNKIMKTDISAISIILVYSIFVIKNIVSYLNAYKWALINADQKGYILTINNLIFQIVTTISKIIILVLTKNYLLFLLIELIIFIIQNFVNTKTIRRIYPYLNDKVNVSLDSKTKNNINKNIRAMFLHNIGGYLVFSTDNILISSFINVSTVGLYSNYTMIIGQLSGLLSPVISGIGAGVGNLIATENEEKIYEIFKTTFFISFWIYSFATIFLYNLLEPFINWWIGEGYLLNKFVFLVVLLNFYINGMRSVIGTYKSKAGLFVQDKYMPALEGVVNLVMSLILIKYLGLVGVFLGTTISTLIIPFWNQPRIVYKELLKKSVSKYFITYLVYLMIMLGVGWITGNLCNLIVGGYSFTSLIVRGVVCVIIPNTIYFILFFNTREFQYLWISIKNQINNLKWSKLSV
ncbi:lipopolysaccharide biosynthesis protein [Clostridium perfringens]|uniref:lipopolysaccharide biosynthesis protein n=1 Tax=Clostridium perfringens TaxID=1502 RepID=UPI0013E2BF53|nr:oligosaccharide flippase family protein [Clostridium perfringens]EHK2306083.1 oligosaccharide flippase family protein [Clostridium perfringens]MDK0636971.1 oligosaccharide flippase family protein [Clostridium perfringens]MDM0797988.1 oligosaccharide flippase family protein [Clostridium perfringens]MDM0861804.1 oligosaccharide flippase family protein [Clostridium perfringens]NGT06911.1 oligosaccharide flippase family protein [Clostridium perfringens]